MVSDESSGRKQNTERTKNKVSAQHVVAHAGTVVNHRTLLVVLQRLLEVGEIPLLVCPRDRAHTLDVPELRILGRELDRQQRRDVFGLPGEQDLVGHNNKRYAVQTYQVEHDLAKKHIFQSAECAWVVLRG